MSSSKVFTGYNTRFAVNRMQNKPMANVKRTIGPKRKYKENQKVNLNHI